MTHGWKQIGIVQPKTTHDITSSRIGIGLEKLDRNLYDPHRCYDELTALGAKWVRIQSGWCRTEKTKGVYDFAWLDDIVDNLLSRDMVPWMCLCYGNELYTEGAVNAAGAVGCPPIKTQTERDAWDAYVRACVTHFKGRVTLYEVWNEPDGDYCWRPKSNPAEYGAFCIRTAHAVKETDENAKIAVGSFFYRHAHLPFLYHALTPELADVTDYITYHGYQYTPENGIPSLVEDIKAIAHRYNPAIRVIQGETGTQSRYGTCGALANVEWTETKQAKFITRKLILDLTTDVAFTSIFSAVDIFENIFTDEVVIHESHYGFFGMLGERFDEDGIPLGSYFRKASFTAMNTVASIFDGTENATRIASFIEPCPDGSAYIPADEPRLCPVDDRNLYTGAFEKENGAKAFVYWHASDLMSTAFESKMTLTLLGVSGSVKLIDTLTGQVYVPDAALVTENDGEIRITSLPVRDYPLILTFGGFAAIRQNA